MMKQTGDFNYLDGNTFEALELPYLGRELSMVVLLPKEKNGLANLEQSLTAAKVNGWLDNLKPKKVTVELPKFKVTSRFNLGDVFSKMSMPLAFSAGADFSGMTQTKLFISDVIHQAFVDVNEEGTEAAAATAVVMRLPGPVVTPINFRANHPFLYLLRDTRTGSILFLGRLSRPQA